jgi:hypothetical protein
MESILLPSIAGKRRNEPPPATAFNRPARNDPIFSGNGMAQQDKIEIAGLK